MAYENLSKAYDPVDKIDKTKGGVRNGGHGASADGGGETGEIKAKIDVLAAKPGKRWDAIVDKILLGIVAALVAYALAQLGLP